jgi:hypothetical protein
MTSQLLKVAAGIGLLFASSYSASAFPTPAPLDTGSMLQPVAQGCGPGGWRGPYGGCRYGRYYRPYRYGYRYYRPYGYYHRYGHYYRAHPFGGYYGRPYYRYGWR